MLPKSRRISASAPSATQIATIFPSLIPDASRFSIRPRARPPVAFGVRGRMDADGADGRRTQRDHKVSWPKMLISLRDGVRNRGGGRSGRKFTLTLGSPLGRRLSHATAIATATTNCGHQAK